MKKQTNNADQDKKYLQALKESDERFRSIVLWSPDAIIVTDVEGKIEYMNPTAEKVFNRKLESFVGKDFGLAIVNGESTEIDIVRPGKDTGVGEMYVVETEWLGEKAHLITIRDITDRKKAEEALRESENKYRLLANNVHDVIFVLDMNLKYTYISPSVKILRGYEPEELLQQTPAGMLTPSSLDLATKTIAETMELEKTEHREINVSRTLQLEMIRKDGTTVWTEVKFSLIRDENQQLVNIMGVTRDITERKQAERALLESEEKYRLVVENAKESIIITQDMKLVFVNNAAISMVGYSKEILTLKSFTDFIHPDDRNMVVDHHIKRIKGEEVPPVYSFRVIGQDGTVIWCELNAAVIQWKGKPATLNFLNNITERRKSEEELKQTLESLRKSIGATIQTMVSAVEMRDPYTAGHQLRVADLACSIAAEIGLPQDKIDGIRMAGSIHDIGKLSIPAEILSKPTKLTDIEFSLIKEHSRSGYEMLKDVESPWPLAQIVYQHHERMNGSGYPRNLKGKEILIEARIMAVADVVEAIASHRPYRPGLGIEVALEEIEKNKGIFYDDAVADACLRLFREKGYQLI
jgi:PAS domain S-box-containing protein